MKQYLIPNEGNFYKANMHTHTTISDGRLTPEEIKAIYKAQGYSVVAFTDHNIIMDHSDLNDEEFLTITGVEINTEKPVERMVTPCEMRCYHLNFYAPRPDTATFPGASLTYIPAAWHDRVNKENYTGNYIRRYDVQAQNEMIAMMREKGFLTSYNHPAWSMQIYPDYATLEGIHTLEVYNSGCINMGYELDASDHVLQDMLCLGKRVFPVATDDIHNTCEACKGWICVKADALDYDTFMTAYGKGDFYASWGPAIEQLWVEDGVLHVECSGVKTIYLVTERRRAGRKDALEGSVLTEGSFDLKQYYDEVHRGTYDSRAFVRLVLVDHDGNKAMTRGYFADELSLAARGLAE